MSLPSRQAHLPSLWCLARQVHKVLSWEAYIVLQVHILVDGWLVEPWSLGWFETPPQAILILGEKLWLCICIALWIWHSHCFSLCSGDTIVEGDKLYITTGWETQNCWAYSVLYMENIRFGVAMVWQGELRDVIVRYGVTPEGVEVQLCGVQHVWCASLSGDVISALWSAVSMAWMFSLFFCRQFLGCLLALFLSKSDIQLSSDCICHKLHP